jgi:NADH-quinone oxidoreductase subunit N
MPVGDLLPEIAVLLGAVATLLLASFVPHGRHWLCAPLSLAALGIAAIFCLRQAGTAELTFMQVWALDGASVWARLLILGASALCVAMTPQWLAADRRHGEFYAILLFSTLGAMAMAAAADLLQLVMGVLLSSVTGYTLAAYHRDWGPSVEAGMKYFLVGALANVVLLIGATLLFGMLGASGYPEMGEALATAERLSPLALLGFALTTVGLGFKLGIVPAHAWMPDVAEAAPVPAAAFLTVVPKVGAAVALIRLVDLVPPELLAVRPLAAILAVATMTLGNLAALWQDDVRRLLGWSSVSQSGYALMAVCTVGADPFAVPALLFFLLGYAVANLAAFAVVAHLRGRTARRDYAGLAAARPLAAAALIVALLSLVGIPPLAGFVGKLTLFATTLDGGYAWLAAVAVVNTVVSLFYYLRVVGPTVFRRPEGEFAVLGGWTAAAVAAGLALTLAAGLLAELALAPFAAARLLP